LDVLLICTSLFSLICEEVVTDVRNHALLHESDNNWLVSVVEQTPMAWKN